MAYDSRGMPLREARKHTTGGRMGSTRQKGWPTAESADARGRQARSSCGISGRAAEQKTCLAIHELNRADDC
jgi:hypothetical protein